MKSLWVAIKVDLLMKPNGFVDYKVNVLGIFNSEQEALDGTMEYDECVIKEVRVDERETFF